MARDVTQPVRKDYRLGRRGGTDTQTQHVGASIGITAPGLWSRIRHRWSASTLAIQFFLVGGVVALAATVVVGAVVAALIERAVTRNAAATTALYVDSVIAPLLPDMRSATVLDDVVKRALDETLGQGALGERLVALRLWSSDGTILYAEDSKLIGRTFARSPSLDRAFSGEIVANYDRFEVLDGGEAPAKPLLEIYNPILEPWSGDVVAVIEFYEDASEFEASLDQALWRSWIAVAATTSFVFLLLATIVMRGSRTIDRQAHDLRRRVGELTRLLDENRALHERVQKATRRATALNESYLRRIGADLHDGPAQLVALASLRLDSGAVLDPMADPARREHEIHSIRSTLEDALQELRSICHGLVLPQIEAADFAALVRHAVEAHERRTGAMVALELDDVPVTTPLAQKICAYRFLQEGLNNSFRHCPDASLTVSLQLEDARLTLSVADDGPGFDPTAIRPDSLGLAGLSDRIESLGGRFSLQTSEKGTRLSMTLDLRGNGG